MFSTLLENSPHLWKRFCKPFWHSLHIYIYAWRLYDNTVPPFRNIPCSVLSWPKQIDIAQKTEENQLLYPSLPSHLKLPCKILKCLLSKLRFFFSPLSPFHFSLTLFQAWTGTVAIQSFIGLLSHSFFFSSLPFLSSSSICPFLWSCFRQMKIMNHYFIIIIGIYLPTPGLKNEILQPRNYIKMGGATSADCRIFSPNPQGFIAKAEKVNHL